MLWYFLLILFLAAEMLTRLELVKSKLMFSRDAQVRLLFQLDITLSKRAATEEEASFYLVYYQIHRSKCCFHCLSGKRGVLPVCFQRYFVAELVVWAFFSLQLHNVFFLSPCDQKLSWQSSKLQKWPLPSLAHLDELASETEFYACFTFYSSFNALLLHFYSL